ncbi:hypothetical protein [Arthrobacter cavernae]|uniref:Uncharacterized protein n=1 Tax=Arthrobacter cavernae TaxID=2817681 RepID=A0A939HJ32_9MICC|nr:hypothetical protein [Arthrobacter cavernae]MBO1269425.1 hypothetical protein [Arthrobacter cavernae]
MNELPAAVETSAAQELGAELARLAIGRVAPDEMLVFAETADEYFADPAGTLKAQRGDEPVGFGLELALLAPFALAVGGFVVQFLGELFADTAKDLAKTPVEAFIRRLLKLPGGTAAAAGEQLTADQQERVFTAAVREGERLGLPTDTATLLGHALVGSLAVGP